VRFKLSSISDQNGFWLYVQLWLGLEPSCWSPT
jgi:hypothetical protein